jgi:hypothetical protein
MSGTRTFLDLLTDLIISIRLTMAAKGASQCG